MIKFLKANHQNIYFFGLFIIAVGLPFSKIIISCGQMILLANWLSEGRFKSKFKDFFNNKIALVISSIFLLHLIGLIYTTDFNYAYKDLKVKIPIIVLPLIIATSETLSLKRFRNLLFLFIAAVISSTFISMYYYLTADFIDIRDISIFASHIRLSLMICLSNFILFYFIISTKEYSKIKKFFFVLIILWLVFFLIILESITGLAILCIISFSFLVYGIYKLKNIFLKVGLMAVLITLPLLIFLYVHSIYKEFYFSNNQDKRSKLEKFTALGNPYVHDTLNNETENGHFVWRNICDPEMQDAWKKRSSIDYNGKDRKNQSLRFTLIRYLTSRGYGKDADGIMKLSPDEIHSIEKGVANYKYSNDYLFRTRIYETIWEYEHYKISANPSASSVFQRLEYWKASLGIIKDNLLFGVGTGDMNIAFDQQYKKMNSRLDMKWRLRSHNQFLSITVGFGLFGLLWFLFSLVYPFFYRSVRKDYFYLVFFAIAVLSMMTEDTIESQVGLTFFVFFNALFLLGRKKENEILSSQ